MNTELNDAEIVALSKVITAAKAKTSKAALTVGEHDVDVTVHITGSLKRGVDYTQAIVAKADPWTLLAVALSHLNGVTVESITREALTADPALVKSLKANAADAIATIKGTTDTDCNGKVTGKVTAVAA